MKRIHIFLLISALIVACGGGDATSDGGSSNSGSSTTDPVASVDAEKLWKTRCVACHGLYGNMGVNGAANLQDVDTPLAERINIITNGKEGENGVMTAFGEILSAEEIEALARYTMSFNEDL